MLEINFITDRETIFIKILLLLQLKNSHKYRILFYSTFTQISCHAYSCLKHFIFAPGGYRTSVANEINMVQKWAT